MTNLQLGGYGERLCIECDKEIPMATKSGMCDECIMKLGSSIAGRKGGEVTKLRGSAFYSEIGKKGMAKRWAKNA